MKWRFAKDLVKRGFGDVPTTERERFYKSDITPKRKRNDQRRKSMYHRRFLGGKRPGNSRPAHLFMQSEGQLWCLHGPAHGVELRQIEVWLACHLIGIHPNSRQRSEKISVRAEQKQKVIEQRNAKKDGLRKRGDEEQIWGMFFATELTFEINSSTQQVVRGIREKE